MSSAVKKVFGGTDDSAQKSQERANARSQKFIEEQAKQARADALSIYPDIFTNIGLGGQGALDTLNKMIPAQMAFSREGNMAAQQTLMNTMPQVRNAILGAPVDMNFAGKPYIGSPVQSVDVQMPGFVNPSAAPAMFDSTTTTMPEQATPVSAALGGKLPKGIDVSKFTGL